MMHQRVVDFLNEAAPTRADEAGALLAVTHGGVIRLLLTHAHRRPLTDSGQFSTDNASITEFHVDAAGTINVVRMNDTSHLDEGLKDSRPEMV
jgi:broad specificity phosphatase PhoE